MFRISKVGSSVKAALVVVFFLNDYLADYY